MQKGKQGKSGANADAAMSTQAQSSTKNANMSMTVGNKQMQEQGSLPDDPKKNAATKEGPATASTSKGGLAKLKDPNQAHENLEMLKTEKAPQARFGHTVTMVNKYKVVLFGGATGDTGKFSMTGETWIFNMFLKTWTELSVKGVAPSPRAAHASTNVE